jgi:hypothetical protein
MTSASDDRGETHVAGGQPPARRFPHRLEPAGDDNLLQAKRERTRWVGEPAGTGPTAAARAAGTEMERHKSGKAKQPRAIRELRARQRKRVAAIRKLNARYAGQTFPKRAAEKWNRLNRELDDTEERITELRARYERIAELDDREG